MAEASAVRAAPLIELGRDPASGLVRAATPEQPLAPIAGLRVVRPEGLVYFGNAATLHERLRTLSADPGRPMRVLLLDCGSMLYVEYSGLQMLRALSEELAAGGQALWLANLQPEPAATFHRAHVGTPEDSTRVFATVGAAITAFEAAGQLPA